MKLESDAETFFVISGSFVDMPVKGPGKGGRVGINEQQSVIASFAKDTTRDEDPREALLKYAKQAQEEPMWISNSK